MAAGPSGADALCSCTSPLTASATCEASGLHASRSGCSSFEFTCLTPEGAGLGVEDGVEVPAALAIGDSSGNALLMGSMTAPWSMLATATIVPSGLIAIGPSSGPSLSGNGLTTTAAPLSQYHAPGQNPG